MQTALRDQDDVLPPWSEHFTEDCLSAAMSVRGCRVKQCYSDVNGAVNRKGHFSIINRSVVLRPHWPATETDCRNQRAMRSHSPVLH